MKVASRSSILNSETSEGSDHTVEPIELLSNLFQKKGFNRGPDCFGLLRLCIADPGGGGGGTLAPGGGGGGGGGGKSLLAIGGGGGGGGGGGTSLPNIGGGGGDGGAGGGRESDNTSFEDLNRDLGTAGPGGGGGGGGGGDNVSSEESTLSIVAGSSILLPFDTVTFLRSAGGGGGGGLLTLNSFSLDHPAKDCLSTWTSDLSATTSCSLSDSLARVRLMIILASMSFVFSSSLCKREYTDPRARLVFAISLSLLESMLSISPIWF